MTTHISYKTGKLLKEFLGKSAPEPMTSQVYNHNGEGPYDYPEGLHCDCPAYQLHDLLSKPFCEAMADNEDCNPEKCWPGIMDSMDCVDAIFIVLSNDYFKGGMEAVEKALVEMMEGPNEQ